MDPNESGNLIKNFVVQNAPGANETATIAQVIQAVLTQFGLNPAQLIAALSEVTPLTGAGTTLTLEDNGKIFSVQTDVDHVIDLPEEDPGVPFSVAFIQAGVQSVVFSGTNGTINAYNSATGTAGQHAWASLIRTGVNTYNLSGTLA